MELSPSLTASAASPRPAGSIVAQTAVVTGMIAANIWAIATTDLINQVDTTWFTQMVWAAVPALMGYLAFARNWRRCALFFGSLGWLFAMSWTTVLAMHYAALGSQPLADDWMIVIDESLGFSMPALQSWMSAHGWIATFFNRIYNLIFLETMMVLLILSVALKRARLTRFVTAFMISLPIVLLAFYAWPAAGPFEAYGIKATEAQTDYLAQLHQLRLGDCSVPSNPKGLVTFPSFHTAWAILLMYALRDFRRLFAVGVVFNALIILSTLTTGWHYLADVLGGGLVALIALVIAGRCCPSTETETPAGRVPGVDAVS